MIDLAQVAEILSAVAALTGIPGAVRNLEADLGRLSHFFTVNYAWASLHRDEIHETAPVQVLPPLAVTAIVVRGRSRGSRSSR